MNRSQQRELIQAQVAQIEPSDDLRIMAHQNDFQLHLDVASYNGRRYHVMLDLEDYDVEPPHLYVMDERGEITWDRSKLPPRPFLNGTQHPLEHRDFFCIPGTHDYHSHPLHQHESWDALRNSTTLGALVSNVARTLKNPPVQAIRVKNLHKIPLKHVIIALDNGEEFRFDINEGVRVGLRAITIGLANSQAIVIEAHDAP